MTGRGAVSSLKQKLNATFERIDGISMDSEVLSDFARYLCVLVSGFLEQSVIEIILEYTRCRSAPPVHHYVDVQLKWRFTNASTERLIQLMNAFDRTWGVDLEAFLVDEYKDAVNGIVDLRNAISHGRFVGVTMRRVRDYFERVAKVVEHIADLCIPL